VTTDGYLTLTGENQGKIQGSCLKKGWVNAIEILHFSHCVDIPKNTETGLPTGRRIHRDIIIQKEIDKSTPNLYQALCTSEKIITVTFSWQRFDSIGSVEPYFTIKLKDSMITKIQPCIIQGFTSSQENYPFTEKISFAYEKIIWTYEPEGMEFEDKWSHNGQSSAISGVL